ncbi:hypothetical protein [Vitiosangium sp. GDMCC 1.1324]|uniref:hypothetical protein n=1 Tax=Vitiosangium sp. (strain GDMCC 1.1324) TaxID=2138576 RepID=UPI000D3CACD9|nr:hypothetical protein [Vitiosangium sp. GDMCC 1.1324]PTL83915.1 hypothetical protein DAT35_10675 [Vitiosangium sp. GDMCC 1.1324]
MSRHGMAVLGIVAALGTAGTAAAAEEQGEWIGSKKIFLRGGAGNYTGNLGEVSKPGPSWGLTLNLGAMSFLGLELSYEGARNVISEAGVLDLALTRHGASALLKLSLPVFEAVRPFVGGGIGGTYTFAKGTLVDDTSDLVGEVPLAAGIDFNAGKLTAGVRATYRLLLDENLSEQIDRPSGGYFDVVATLGMRF